MEAELALQFFERRGRRRTRREFGRQRFLVDAFNDCAQDNRSLKPNRYTPSLRFRSIDREADMIRTIIFSALIGAALCSCETATKRTVMVVGPAKVKGQSIPSKPVSIPLQWAFTYETVPQSDAIWMWVNESPSPILANFEQDYHSFGNDIQMLRFGSLTNKPEIVAVTLWPPGTLNQLQAEMKTWRDHLKHSNASP